MTRPSALRFFAAMDLHPTYAFPILLFISGFGVWTTTMSPGELDSGLGMLLIAQMFMASTGFLGRARRGHFDPMLGAGRNRTHAVACHWLVSVAPGLAGWLCLSGAAYLQGSPAAVSALAGSRFVALFIVSAVSWVAGFMLVRGAAGVVWVAVLLSLLVARADLLSPAAGAASTWQTLGSQTLTLVLCPFLLLGPRTFLPAVTIAAAGLVAGLLLLVVWRSPDTLDIYLVDRA